ncbi:hypothetical protein CYLTODRAFT_290653 [Cylindrobasidium torrendii FP15055 ss-10]|uniref:Uncharacterized protein n=1 Tax=Cylindrobasidium torrendii FP15055 ss-10 TaxID=1314674 RepID=A0A0D7AQS4_9AGAR|nr:hypothetical protein CYLTODRAFT_290653 [Cylindrobasidium torrendii FP15055 ss-10]
MSGSAVLAMLTNVLYEDADLDWIVDLPGRAGVVEFLQDEGFQSRDMWSGCKYYAEMNSVLSVWEFVRGEARVQVVTVDGTPFESVMAFHSTVVCNIFTSSSLVCMYAKETLMDKVNVAISADVSQPASVQALMKYAARGWSLKYAMVGMPDADRRTRFVGDSHCLVYHHGTCRDNIFLEYLWCNGRTTPPVVCR